MGIVVLIYHKTPLAPDGDSFTVTLDRFKEHVEALRAAGFEFAPFSCAREAARAGGRPSVCFTFDDAHASNIAAVEHLASLGVRPTVFVVQRWTENDPAFMSADDIRRLSPVCDFGSHSVSHADLTRLSDSELADELGGSRSYLEAILARPVTSLAFPGGRFDQRAVRAARAAGYAAIGTSEPFDERGRGATINRYTVHAWDTGASLLRVVGAGRATWLRRRMRIAAARAAARWLPPAIQPLARRVARAGEARPR